MQRSLVTLGLICGALVCAGLYLATGDGFALLGAGLFGGTLLSDDR